MKQRVQIAINGRYLGRRVTGVERYAREVVSRLGGEVRLVKPRRPASGLRGHMWEQAVLPRSVQKGELLWSPANSGPMSLSGQVVTIHDASVLEHPEWFSADYALWYRVMLPALARRARHVLTVSEHSRKAIMRKLRVPAHNITAVPNGVDPFLFRPQERGGVLKKYGLSDRYVLYVGSIDPRKNLGRLLQAWDRAAPHAATELVIAGDHGRAFRSERLTRGTRGVRFLGYVPEEDLPGLYAGAHLFVMPSLYEGFGLTVLEAMACGTPVLASSGGALPEVTNGAAYLCDPTSVEDMAEALCRLLEDAQLRAELRECGLQRAHELNWERSARKIHEVLVANG